MAFFSNRLHPLVAAAAVSVIIASVTASAVMTGVLQPHGWMSAGRLARAPVPQSAGGNRDSSPETITTSGDAANGTTASGTGALATGPAVPAAGEVADGGAAATAGAGPGAAAGIAADNPQSAQGAVLRSSRTLPVPADVARPPSSMPLAGKLQVPPVTRSDRYAAPPVAGLSPPPAVFIHVYDASARQQMQRFEPVLRQHGMRLAGIKIVGTGPAQSDLRYFHAGERSEAETVQAALLSAGLPIRRLKMISGYEARATPRQYEVWLSPGFQAQR